MSKHRISQQGAIMTKNIQAIKQKIYESLDNYRSLRDEELYLFYKHDGGELDQDQLDYLMCQALCCMPNIDSINSNTDQMIFLRLLKKIINSEKALDPQLEIISQVVAKRELLDICNNWTKRVMLTYESILKIHAQNLIKHVRLHERFIQQQSYSLVPNKALIFSTSAPSEEECSDWLTKDFTALVL